MAVGLLPKVAIISWFVSTPISLELGVPSSVMHKCPIPCFIIFNWASATVKFFFSEITGDDIIFTTGVVMGNKPVAILFFISLLVIMPRGCLLLSTTMIQPLLCSVICNAALCKDASALQ